MRQMCIVTSSAVVNGGSFERRSQPPVPGFIPRGTTCWRRLLIATLFASLALVSARAVTYTNIFFTQFESAQGYNSAYELAGQKDWLRYPAVYGGNGILDDFLGTQAGYVGFWALNPLTNSLTIYRQIDYVPPANKYTLVKFSAAIDVEDSTDENGRFDQFWWVLRNGWDDPLFTLCFDNDNWDIYYGLENQEFVSTGSRFTNGVLYELVITMDFYNNHWSAVLSNQAQVLTLAMNLPITTGNTPLNFGSMDLAWVPQDPANPGDNFLIFDNYRVAAEIYDFAPGAAQVEVRSPPAGNNLPLRVYGPNGSRQAVDFSTSLKNWTPLRTNTINGGFYDYVDPNAGGPGPRFYRARLVL